MPSKRKPTIYDLAALAGTSPSTVSAVINGSWQQRRIGAATAERVMQLAWRFTL
jgi:LacI family transcriptional regulator, fructose operon transcriptional repressor